MLKYKYLTGILAILMSLQTGFSQTIKSGEKMQALINNVWKEVVVLKAVEGKAGQYQVKIANARTTQQSSVLVVSKANLRAIIMETPVSQPVIVETPKPVDPHLGRYELYSGIPATYLGHLILLTNGKYKVAFSTDEEAYEIGNYIFHPETNTIEWLNGMFKNNNWGGKLVNNAGVYKIEFNKASFAESN